MRCYLIRNLWFDLDNNEFFYECLFMRIIYESLLYEYICRFHPQKESIYKSFSICSMYHISCSASRSVFFLKRVEKSGTMMLRWLNSWPVLLKGIRLNYRAISHRIHPQLHNWPYIYIIYLVSKHSTKEMRGGLWVGAEWVQLVLRNCVPFKEHEKALLVNWRVHHVCAFFFWVKITLIK